MRMYSKLIPLLIATVIVVFGVVLLVLRGYIPQEKKIQSKMSVIVVPNTSDVTTRNLHIRLITFPKYHISFEIPDYLKTFQESNTNTHIPAGTTYLSDSEVRFYDGISSIDHESECQNSGIKIVFKIDNWSPNIDNIPFGDAFNGEGKTKHLDSSSLLVNNSIVPARSVNFYTYLMGDDLGHNRGKLGSVHQGDVRLDLETADHVYETLGINFNCYDHTTKSMISKRCDDILMNFLSSLRVGSAKLLTPPPDYTDEDYFSNLEFKKRQFDPEEKVVVYAAEGSGIKDISNYPVSPDEEILTVKDSDLSVMRCMPEQIFLNRSNSWVNSLYSIFLYTNGSAFSPINPVDPVFSNIVNSLNKLQEKDYEVSQFIACQTDDNRFIVKYNLTSKDQEVSQSSKPLIAKFAQIWPNGYVSEAASIPLPSNYMRCWYPMELTKKNLLYFECVEFPFANEIQQTDYIYRLDLNTRSYTLISTCDFRRDWSVKCR